MKQSKESRAEAALANMTPSRRQFIRNAARAGFLAPVIASFTMSGLMARPASAQANMS